MVDPAGTTLESTIVRVGTARYFRLGEGPGWPSVVRDELAAPRPGREDRRRPVAAVVHLTDVHVVDAQSPARVEFLDRFNDPPTEFLPVDGAFRAQETLTAHVAVSMIERVNALARAPVTGRPFDCAVSTGDNIDNMQRNELRWFLELLDGATVTANSGDRSRYEGVQDTEPGTFDPHYWHPDDGLADNYKQAPYNFVSYDGLLAAAIAPFPSAGLDVPWYSTYGNHDGLLQGNSPTNPAFESIATGDRKVTGTLIGLGTLQQAFDNGDPSILLQTLQEPNVQAARTVTPDDERATASASDWVDAHLRSASAPDGHGYTEENSGTGTLHYTFPIAPGVLGVSLDTVNRGGYAEGSIGTEQLAWLEERLREAHGRHLDAGGGEVRTGHADQLVVLFSHHNLFTLENPFPDPARPTEQRVGAEQVRALLHRFPNVVAWVNGHSHVNRVTPLADPARRTGGFWEISTAAHIDYPQHARLVEIVDNRDGTLSIHATIIEHAAPVTGAVRPGDPLALAAISRELSANEIQGDPTARLGSAADLNVELLLRAPFDLDGPPGPGGSGAPPPGPASGGPDLPATGNEGHLPAVVGTAALAAALAIRSRRKASDPPG